MFLHILFFNFFIYRDTLGEKRISTATVPSNSAILVLKMLYSNTEVSAGD